MQIWIYRERQVSPHNLPNKIKSVSSLRVKEVNQQVSQWVSLPRSPVSFYLIGDIQVKCEYFLSHLLTSTLFPLWVFWVRPPENSASRTIECTIVYHELQFPKCFRFSENMNLNLNTGLQRNRQGRETKLLGLINVHEANEAEKGGKVSSVRSET